MASDPNGHVKMSRKAFRKPHEGGDPFWNEPRVFSRWEAWQYLIQAAAFADHSWLIPDGPMVQIRRGETPPLSRSTLARVWRWTEKRVRVFFALLDKEGRIGAGQETPQGHTYVVVNYDLYQGEGPGEGQQKGQSGARRGPGEGRIHKQDKQEKKNTLDDFAVWWAGKWRRAGDHGKARAAKHWNARRKEGFTVEELTAARDRYTAFLRSGGKEGTEFAKQAASFLGDPENIRNEWTPAPPPPGRNGHRAGEPTQDEIIERNRLERVRRLQREREGKGDGLNRLRVS